YQHSSQPAVIETIEPSVDDGRTTTKGAPSDRATPATVRGCVDALKSSTARERFMSAFVGTAWTWRDSRRSTGAGRATGGEGAGAGAPSATYGGSRSSP